MAVESRSLHAGRRILGDVDELSGDVVRHRASRVIVASAREAFASLLGDATQVDAGVAEEVRAPDGSIGYWLVPGLAGDRIVAIARVLPDGMLATVGEVERPAVDAAQVVTGLSAAQAREALGAGEARVSEPMLVHDGPVGREAWLSVVTTPGSAARWLFATAGGTYERAAGAPLGPAGD
jgi:hypothetical protein